MEHILVKSKITKKTNAEFTADNIDTTAPPRKILEYLWERNFLAMEMCHKVVAPRSCPGTGYVSIDPGYHRSITGHPLSAFPDDWDGGLNSRYFETFPYKCFAPKMITRMQNIGKDDPVTAIMKQKTDWKSNGIMMHKNCTNVLKKRMLDMTESLSDGVMFCPKAMVDIAAHLDSDPHPYFDINSTCNWLYAGNGNLCQVSVNWVDYLLHSEFGTVYLSQFSRSDLTLNPEPTATFDCGDANIYETICSTHNTVALRTKHKVLILKITSEEKIVIEKVQGMDSEQPFTSISFDDYHKNILYVTSLDNKLTIVNLDRLKVRTVMLQTKSKSLVNNWHTVIGSERPYYTHVNKSAITVYDKRTNTASRTWDNLVNISDEGECNDICAVKQCEGSPYMYVGTDHHIFLMDLRNESSKIRAVQRFTHGMLSVPTYISMTNFESNKHLLCISSQWCEDTCVLSNYNLSLVQGFQGVTIPYRPPSIFSALKEARHKSLCSDLISPLDKRLSMAITGNLIFEQQENCVILTQNSVGDIASQTIFPEHMESFLEDDSMNALHEWSKEYKLDKKPFVVSNIVDLKRVWKRLKHVPEDYKVGEGKYCYKKNTTFKKKEIFDTFKKEGLDEGLLDVWLDDPDKPKSPEPQSRINNTLDDDISASCNMTLRYDDDDSE